MNKIILSSVLSLFLSSSFLYAEDNVKTTNTVIEESVNNVNTLPLKPMETTIINKEPINVIVSNFPVELKTHDVKILNDSLKVEINNPINLKEKEQNKIQQISVTTNDTIIENFSLLGEVSTSLQDISLFKSNVKNSLEDKTGLRIKMVANDEVEISKDNKIVVINEVYIDDDEVKNLILTINKIIDFSNKNIKENDFKISFVSKSDFKLEVYTYSKMFGQVKDIECKMILGKNEKFNSISKFNIDKLKKFQEILIKYDSIKLKNI
jgi:hypothetical protein